MPAVIACRLLVVYPTCMLVAIDGKLQVLSSLQALFSSSGPMSPRDGTIRIRKAA
jgi:hypothetical protein